DLATTAGPSFKPLPVLALAPLSALGDATPAVWMGLMRAAAVLSLLLAYRLGARLAGPLAGAVAALGLALSADLYRTALLGSGDPLHASSTATSATEGSAANAKVPAFEVVRRAADAIIVPTLILAAIGVALAVRRRDRPVLSLAAVAVGWIAVVAVMAEVG